MTDEIVSRETKMSNELRKIRFGERVVCYILSRLNESNLTDSKISIELKKLDTLITYLRNGMITAAYNELSNNINDEYLTDDDWDYIGEQIASFTL